MISLGDKLTLPDCPKCAGTKLFKNVPCNNCGGQYMFGEPTGKSRYNSLGLPCLHEYTISLVSKCYYTYKCNYCTLQFHVDTGD